MTSDGGFEEFYAASYRPLLRVLLPLVVDAHAAEELAQEAFLRAYRDWTRLSTYDDPRAWLYRVGMRLAVSRWRRLRSAAAALVRYGPPSAGEEAGGRLCHRFGQHGTRERADTCCRLSGQRPVRADWRSVAVDPSSCRAGNIT